MGEGYWAASVTVRYRRLILRNLTVLLGRTAYQPRHPDDPIAAAGFPTNRGILWGEMAAVGVTASIPVIVVALIVQKRLLRGLTLGAVQERLILGSTDRPPRRRCS